MPVRSGSCAGNEPLLLCKSRPYSANDTGAAAPKWVMAAFSALVLLFIQPNPAIQAAPTDPRPPCLHFPPSHQPRILTPFPTLTQYECQPCHPAPYLPIIPACFSQMFPQMKFRLSGLDPKVGPIFVRPCRPSGQVHPPAGHHRVRRLQIQVPQ